ncbi:hypothetical protein N0V84_003408 [Fusarium piperis]|uniref:Zn(2)-C6 fungal-type domain-containing protein n=1 Tax=Fusarium piperis TaxID=1435070 RepID=A0A9W8WHM9_9HYPO|nr:hypothetical protein N0V84_003408 [Fusarium piperis]
MTRARVRPDMRKRAATACDTCKKRKQKCDSHRPCNPCRKRRVVCRDHGDKSPEPSNRVTPASPSRRRCVDRSPDSSGYVYADMDSDNTDDGNPKVLPMLVSDSNFEQVVVPLKQREVELHTEAWMMRDLTNRGFYVGNSSTSSSLVVISTVVGFVSGGSSFTDDPDRFKMPEAPFIAPSSPQVRPLLPDIKHARILKKSFFDNIQGLLWVLDPSWTDMALDRVYAAPDSAEASDRCLVYLVLAIGFTMGPVSLSLDHNAAIHEMRMLDDQWGERLFAAAKSIGDPMTAFEDEGWSEDGGLWSVQTLTLMSYFALLVSRRNAAYAYCGMAVRSAHALGIHMASRTDVLFTDQHMIKLIRWAIESHEMRVFDSLTLHVLFDAALIVLSNDYAGIHDVHHAEFWITQAMDALKMSAGPHRHADKSVSILESFRQAKKGDVSKECWKKDVGLAGNGELYQLSTGSFVQGRPPSCSPVNDAWISPCESRRGSLVAMYPWGTQCKDGGPLGGWPTTSFTDNHTPQSQGFTDGTGSSHGEEGEVGFDWLSKQ